VNALGPDAGVVVLDSSRGRRIWLLIASLILLLAGIVIVALNETTFVGWLGVAAFGGGVWLLVVELFRPDRLTLTRDKFTYRSGGRGKSIPWADVAEFGVSEVRIQGGVVRQVGIRLNGQTSLLRRQMVSGITGAYDVLLPDTYGLHVYDLAELMETWRKAA
jgi:hypothetical protein